MPPFVVCNEDTFAGKLDSPGSICGGNSPRSEDISVNIRNKTA
jgi:hypothetical protein